MRKELQPGLTIVVPIYNEEESLPRLGEALAKFLQSTSIDCDILFVDDGSTDQSLILVKQLCAEETRFTYISFVQNCGLSAAIKAGFDHSVRAWTGYMDADLQTTPEDFNLLWENRDQFDLVTGIRADRQDGLVKRMSSGFANWFRQLFTHDGISDTGCPLKIIRTPIAQQIPMFKGLHRFLPAMVMLQNATVRQIPVRHFPREQGQSKFNVGNRLIGPLMDCFAYRWMKKRYIQYQIEATHDS